MFDALDWATWRSDMHGEALMPSAINTDGYLAWCGGQDDPNK